MKDIIIDCENMDEVLSICYNIPINKNCIDRTISGLVDVIKNVYDKKACFRLESGAICGYDAYGRYQHSKYKHFSYHDFVSSQLTYTEVFDYKNIAIHTKTKKEAEELISFFPLVKFTSKRDWIDHYNTYHSNTIYVTNNGFIRHYGRIDSVNSDYPVIEFAEHKNALKAFIKLRAKNYVRIKTRKQLEWMQYNIGGAMNISWDNYKSNTVMAVSNMELFYHDTISHMTCSTITPFEEFKKDVEIYKRKTNNDKVLYIHCATPIEARYVCKNYLSCFAPFSYKYWIKCFCVYEHNTTYKILDGKIVGATSKSDLQNTFVKEFNSVFPNAEESSDFRVCDHCGEVDNNPESSFFIDINGNVISMNHAHNYKQCELCGEFEYVGNITLCDGSEVCSNCIETATAICDACGERHLRHNTMTDNRNVTLCNQCRTDFIMCESCGNFTPRADATEYNNYYYCSGCLETVKRNHAICNYYYKPKPIFYGDETRYFGVELEVDGAGENTANAYKILCATNFDNEYIYIKHDGSLEDGFEIVSHPMTLNYHHHNMDWKTVMDIAIGQGYFSHNTNSCGLHVHVNRTSLGATESEQEETIAKILFFVEFHWNEIVKFTRRSEYAINRWAARYGFETGAKKILNKAKEHGRYSAVNLNNEHTIEFRIFRGTLKYNTFIATLQFVNRICELALTSTESEIESTSWLDFISNINEPELIQYLKERKLYINEDVNTEEEI